jgi:putative transposase
MSSRLMTIGSKPPRSSERGSVEETLNAFLHAEANRLCNTQRYDARAGYPSAIVHEGQRGAAEGVETANIERYRPSLVEDALIEMYLAGVTARRVEDIIEAFWGCPGVAGDALAAVQKDLRHDRAMAQPRDRGYLCLDGIVLKRSWGRSP